MNTLPLVMRAVLDQPWAVLPAKLDAVLAVLSTRATGRHATEDDIRAALGGEGVPQAKASIGGGVAVLPLQGLLVPRASGIEESSGVQSLQRFGAWVDEATRNEQVHTLLLDVDSPGGSVGLVAETWAKLMDARAAGKRVVAQVNTLAASAAYWIASAADEIVCTPSGDVGAIGVITVRADYTKAAEQEGVAFHVLTSGKYKGEGHPLSPMTDEEREATLARLDAVYGQFVTAIAKGRGVAPSAVRSGFGEGRVVGAAAAKAAGMVDRIATLDETLARLTTKRSVRVATRAALNAPGLAADLSPSTTTHGAGGVLSFTVTAGSGFSATATTADHAKAADFAARVVALAAESDAASAVPLSASGGEPAPSVVPLPTPALKAKDHMTPEEIAALKAENDALKVKAQRAEGFNALRKDHPEIAGKLTAWEGDGVTLEQAQAKTRAELQSRLTSSPAPTAAPAPAVRVGAPNAERDPAKGFRSARDFLVAAMQSSDARNVSDVSDERLRPLAVAKDEGTVKGEGMTFMLPHAFTPPAIRAAAGADEQGAYDDRYGGFAVPTTTLAGVLELGFEGDPTAGRTQSVPMATPQVDIIARTDKDHSTSVSGGFTVARRAETAAATASRGEIEKVSLKASSLFGLAYATEEILTDSPISFAAIIEAGFRDQYMHQILKEKLRGGGGNEFSGVISAACTVSVSKESGQAADTINYQNVIKMRARCWGYGNAVWLANHDCYPQLSVLAVPVGVGGALVYQQSLADDRPDRLLGRPIFYTEYASTIGDVGDLILGNWSQFLEGTYQPLQSAESMHVRFVNHERTFKFWMRNAGAPWWRSALTPNQSTATLSPFVTLAARA